MTYSKKIRFIIFYFTFFLLQFQVSYSGTDVFKKPLDSQEIEQFKTILKEQRSIFESLKYNYDDQIEFFQKIQDNESYRKNFYDQIIKVFFKSWDELEKNLIEYPKAKKVYECIKKQKILPALLKNLQEEAQNYSVYTKTISKIINQFNHLSSEERLFRVSRLWNHFLNLRTQYLKQQKYYLYEATISELPEYQITNLRIYDQKEFETPIYYQYLIEEANLKLLEWDQMLQRFYPYISEAYLDLSALFHLESDLYLKEILNQTQQNPLPLQTSCLMNTELLEPTTLNQNLSRYLNLKSSQKASLEQVNALRESHNAFEIFKLFRDYESLKTSDEQKRISYETRLKKFRKIFPLKFEPDPFFKKYFLLDDSSLINAKRLSLGQCSFPATLELTLNRKFEKNLCTLSPQTHDVLTQIFNQEIPFETWIDRFCNPEQPSSLIHWSAVQEAYRELKICWDQQPLLDAQPQLLGPFAIQFDALNPVHRTIVFHRSYGPLGVLLPKTLKRLQKAFETLGWTRDRLSNYDGGR